MEAQALSFIEDATVDHVEAVLGTLRELPGQRLSDMRNAIAAEISRREWGLGDSVTSIDIDHGCVDQRSLGYMNHRRGRNWLATVEHDPNQPNALARAFWATTSGSYRALPQAGVRRGDILEVGADYYTGGGNPDRHRYYFVVVSATKKRLLLVPCAKPGKTAKSRARAMLVEAKRIAATAKAKTIDATPNAKAA